MYKLLSQTQNTSMTTTYTWGSLELVSSSHFFLSPLRNTANQQTQHYDEHQQQPHATPSPNDHIDEQSIVSEPNTQHFCRSGTCGGCGLCAGGGLITRGCDFTASGTDRVRASIKLSSYICNKGEVYICIQIYKYCSCCELNVNYPYIFGSIETVVDQHLQISTELNLLVKLSSTVSTSSIVLTSLKQRHCFCIETLGTVLQLRCSLQTPLILCSLTITCSGYKPLVIQECIREEEHVTPVGPQ